MCIRDRLYEVSLLAFPVERRFYACKLEPTVPSLYCCHTVAQLFLFSHYRIAIIEPVGTGKATITLELENTPRNIIKKKSERNS